MGLLEVWSSSMLDFFVVVEGVGGGGGGGGRRGRVAKFSRVVVIK